MRHRTQRGHSGETAEQACAPRLNRSTSSGENRVSSGFRTLTAISRSKGLIATLYHLPKTALAVRFAVELESSVLRIALGGHRLEPPATAKSLDLVSASGSRNRAVSRSLAT